ncbi:MAG: HipA N-terminal domain-containing protein [Bacteroidota bacterium]
MRVAQVLYKGEKAGILSQEDDGSFRFQYEHTWLAEGSKPRISHTLPKRKAAYHSPYLFPFFYHMLPEGSNRQAVCYYHRIDEYDDFSILLITANEDTIGAVSVKQSPDGNS